MTQHTENGSDPLVIVALCFAFAALLWTAGGAVFERRAFDNAGHSDD